MAIGLRKNSTHWRTVAANFLFDVAIVWFSFAVGVWIRFSILSLEKLFEYGPGVLISSLVLPVVFYVGGFYSPKSQQGDLVTRIRWLSFGFLSVVLVVLAVGSIDFSSRIGRGVLAASGSILVLLLSVRHLFIGDRNTKRWKNVLCLVTGEEDEAAAAMLNYLWGKESEAVGLVNDGRYSPKSSLPRKGSVQQFFSGDNSPRVDFLLVRDQHLANPRLGRILRRLRYEGVEIMSLADACEEAYHAVPLGLITDSWLFRASNAAGLFYIKKLKRLFDIIAALFFLVVLSPLLAIGALIVKLSSQGPILFRQVRAGRLERPITVIKLRTMTVDSEARGAQWSGSDDPRIIKGGHFLRKFRIDEIPQLINVLRGDMSFVGPRPEQLSMIETLDDQISFYRERLLIQPGLTGWAQVRYPYGASVKDAARKLEYDLYYMKHMSVIFDCFFMIETIKIILSGGVPQGGDRAYLEFLRSLEFSRMGDHRLESKAQIAVSEQIDGSAKSS